MTFHEILSRERKARGLSQEELAVRVGVSRQAVSKWETGDAAPDLNKLLALADALGISLDALCGREAALATAAAAPKSAPRKRRRLLLFLCGALVACLAAGGLWAWSQRNVVPSETAQAESTLPDTFTVSGVGFSGVSDYQVSYQFTPSISETDYTYQITFSAPGGKASTFDAAYSGGVCSGTASLEGGWLSYTVTVSVSDGVNSRNLAVANNLSFDRGGASWTPLP